MKWKICEAAALTRTAVILATGTAAFAVRVFAQDSAIDDSAWARMDTRTLNTLPPAFILRPTHFAGDRQGGMGGMAKAGNKMLGRAISFDALMSLAYDVDVIQVVSPPDKPTGRFDLLITTPDASKEKLQAELARSFGYVAHTETRATDVLLLQLKQAGAPGLKPSQGSSGGRGSSSSSSSSSSRGAGVGVRTRQVAMQNQPISIFVKNLQAYFDKPLLDRTGLTGNFDFVLEVALGNGGSESGAIMRALPTQLGLELVPSHEPLELLVVQKTK